jgi:hypothetical protein
MSEKTFLILGGYGNAGRPLARLLLQETDVRLVVAGRDPARAEAAANELNRIFPGGRVTGQAVDASDPASLGPAFQGIDLVLVASSTVRYARQVAEEALQAGLDYLDIQYSTQKVAALKALAPQIEQAGRCFITDGGFHPGLPAALVRYAASYFDRMEKANVGSVIKEDWTRLNVPDETAQELLAEIGDFVPLVFEAGRWQQAAALGMGGSRRMDFGEPFGRQYCVPMFLEEMRSLPEQCPDLRETGFFVGGFNWFVDWLVLPLAMVGLRFWSQGALSPLARLMNWGLRSFSKPPFGLVMRLEAQGSQAGEPRALAISLCHPDGYLFTAIPVVACLLQYLDGSIRKPGLWTQANLVEPLRFVRDLQRMGIEVRVE